ncbi:hypothetical protein EBR56_02290 [bacterium]|nr:hypothetical protein [bacterium]
MSTASVRAARLPPAAGDESSNPPGKWIAAIAILALIAFLVAWLGGWMRFTIDPRVAEIRTLQEEARQKFATNGGPQTLAEATEAVTAMATIRQKTEALPASLRPQVERSGGSVFRSAMRQRIDAYFSLPPEKRQAELDRQIKQEEMMRKAFETAGRVAGFFGGGPPGGGGQGGGPPGTGGQGGGPPGGGGPPPNASQEGVNKWRKQMIDSTTPEQRARYVEYRRAMDQRRNQLGMPSFGPR